MLETEAVRPGYDALDAADSAATARIPIAAGLHIAASTATMAGAVTVTSSVTSRVSTLGDVVGLTLTEAEMVLELLNEREEDSESEDVFVREGVCEVDLGWLRVRVPVELEVGAWLIVSDVEVEPVVVIELDIDRVRDKDDEAFIDALWVCEGVLF